MIDDPPRERLDEWHARLPDVHRWLNEGRTPFQLALREEMAAPSF